MSDSYAIHSSLDPFSSIICPLMKSIKTFFSHCHLKSQSFHSNPIRSDRTISLVTVSAPAPASIPHGSCLKHYFIISSHRIIIDVVCCRHRELLAVPGLYIALLSWHPTRSYWRPRSVCNIFLVVISNCSNAVLSSLFKM